MRGKSTQSQEREGTNIKDHPGWTTLPVPVRGSSAILIINIYISMEENSEGFISGECRSIELSLKPPLQADHNTVITD